jgi:asparagine synthase (glutamine-hydrolysing)
MCGIAVAIGWDQAAATVERLLQDISHRGDITDPILTLSPTVAMGTRRLRIVDAEGAVQPQRSFDDRVLVCLNGQIYNHAELRKELEALGVKFRTQSDTEVLASSLRVWGAGALKRINGMYSFVAVDAVTGEFAAARDPFGVKPLYLIQSGNSFLFCSEIRPLLASVEKGDVLFLPPGHLLTRAAVMRFESIFADQAVPTIQHDPTKLDAALSSAVHVRLPTDLPFALMFSGGVDSTLIAHYARQIHPNAPGYFLGGPQAPDYRYAAEYADRTGFDLRCVAIDDRGDPLAMIRDVVATTEAFEPSVIRNGFCNYLLSRRIHENGFRVALCGEGADELFAGYPPLEVAFADDAAVGGFVRDQYVGNMHRGNLQRLDRCGMRFQLEVREPFLDPTVATYALGLPPGILVESDSRGLRGKAPLRSLWALHQDRLPISIRDRLKTPLQEGAGFEKSVNDSPWACLAEDWISDRDFAEGRRRFAAFDLRSKEEFLYLRELAETLDVARVPHLTARARIAMPTMKNPGMAKRYLSEHLLEA